MCLEYQLILEVSVLENKNVIIVFLLVIKFCVIFQYKDYHKSSNEQNLLKSSSDCEVGGA